MLRYKAIAKYYDAEYAESKMLRHDVPFFLGQLQKKKMSILELAVGTGRAAIPMAQAGHRVVGVDYAVDMLEIAKHKRDAAGLDEKQLQLIHQDVLKLKLKDKFDWICIYFNTLLAFVTLEEQDRLLQRVTEHLAKNGRFWIDIFNPDMRLLTFHENKGLEPRIFFVPELNRTVYQTTDIQRNLANQSQIVTFHYNWFDEFGQKKQQKHSFGMTWIFPRELQLLLERNGLKIERLWGNYDGSELKAESPRIIVRCVKR